MLVTVEILTGSLFHVEVGDEATVGDLKREIGAQQKLPVDRLILVLDKEQIQYISKDQDGEPLVNCGIKDGCRIYLFFTSLDDPPDPTLPFTLPDSPN